MSENETQERHRKERQGEVVSDKGNKTIVVQVKRRVQHPLYKKVISHYKKFHAHDPENAAKVGDEVRIRECKPVSKLKRWELLEVVS
jgi:small subunit ribosomal protein S17|tara:strand:- start:2325 stop:2585 length:261 start_codon:yes stop_codon:yes gene_type:complete